jgi:hypothetical protein
MSFAHTGSTCDVLLHFILGGVMRQRYVLYPGLVAAGSEGNLRFIGASALARLYGVDIQDCMVFDPAQRSDYDGCDDCVHLYPRDE